MRTCLACTLFFLLVPGAHGEGTPDFARDVQPILAAHCFRCHGAQKQEAGLRLDVRQRALSGGDSGPVIVTRASAKSDLVRRITAADRQHRMPPTGKGLAAGEVALLKRWIDQGAPWPDELAGKDSAAEHWAFRPIKRPEVPRVQHTGWPRNPIDYFLLARLEKDNRVPAPEADRQTLVRRLHLDLIGLPPTPAEVHAFVQDGQPDAYEKLVERLLASPHFGERWGRHWLDLVRYAESDGYENDNLRPDAWRYRDWVVHALNQDMPYDQFTVEQLAGDLLPAATLEQRIAAGLHRNTLHNSAASGDKEEFRTYAVKDRIDTTGTVWLGLTLGCAKCHSHKYDPVSQREYYQLYAFFNRTDNHEIPVAGGKALSLKAVARPTHIHVRGNFLQKGAEVTPAVPAFLPPLKARGPAPDRLDLARWLGERAHPLPARVAVNRMWQLLFGRGLVPTPDNYGTSGTPPTHPELLDWLATEFISPSPYPLPLRGGEGYKVAPLPLRGGEGYKVAPLPLGGGEGRVRGWSQKQTIKTIVLSAAYRQSSRIRPELLAADPNNDLVARQNRLRVEGEIVRDLALAVSGLLDPKFGGPSIVPPFPNELPTGQLTAESLKRPTPERHRRSLYIHVQRTLVHPVLATFDPADPNQPCVRRERSCTPMQSLALLNDPTFAECAQGLGRRILRSQPNRDGRIEFACRLCLGRPPLDAEKAILEDLIDKQEKLKAAEEAVWTGVARTLLNLEAFTTRE